MTTLKIGSRHTDVKVLQQKLNLAIDGIFGPLTHEAVKEFQKAHGLFVDGIVGESTWKALGITAPSNPRMIDEIIVHYTATPEGEEFSNEQIRSSHIARGFADIGYHYVIGLKGEIRPGRDESVVGAHCTGHNTHSIGVCYVGGCPDRSNPKWFAIGKDTRTPQQKEALIALLKKLKAKYPKATIHGHREFASKPCPGFDAKNEYKNLI